MTIPIYVLKRVPGADESAVEWTDICHQRPMVVIRHQETRDTSRWVTVDRKKPFCVWGFSRKSSVFSHDETWWKTFDAAKRAAAEWVADYEERQRLAARPKFSHAYTLTFRVYDSRQKDASDVTPAALRSAIANLSNAELVELCQRLEGK